jgi:hypothetical protein
MSPPAEPGVYHNEIIVNVKKSWYCMLGIRSLNPSNLPLLKGVQGGILWADLEGALAGRLMSAFLSR